MITQNIAFIGRQRSGKDFSVEKLKSKMQQNEDMVLVRFAEPLKTLSNIIFGEFGKDEDIKDSLFPIPYSKMIGRTQISSNNKNYRFDFIIYELEKLLVEFYSQALLAESTRSFVNQSIEVLEIQVLTVEQLKKLMDYYKSELDEVYLNYISKNKPLTITIFFESNNLLLGEDTNIALRVLMLYAHYLSVHVKSDGVNTSPRIFQQVMGTDIFRQLINPNFWSFIGYKRAEQRAFDLNIQNDSLNKIFIVSPDVRFPNELPPTYPKNNKLHGQTVLNYIFRLSRDNMLPMAEEDIKKLHPSEVFQEVLRNHILKLIQEQHKDILLNNKHSFTLDFDFNLEHFYNSNINIFQYFGIQSPEEKHNYLLIAHLNYEE